MNWNQRAGFAARPLLLHKSKFRSDHGALIRQALFDADPDAKCRSRPRPELARDNPVYPVPPPGRLYS